MCLSSVTLFCFKILKIPTQLMPNPPDAKPTRRQTHLTPNPPDAKLTQCQTHPTSNPPNTNPTFVAQLVECTTHDPISEGSGFNSSQFLYHICGIHTQFICVLKCCKGIGLGLQKLSMHATYVSKELAGIEPRTLERWHY